MNILPRVNYASLMLPLPPPSQHWDAINEAMSTFLWKNKRARVKLGTLQRRSLSGGWGIPNFERYHHASILRALHVWFDENARVAWRPIESANVSPHRLQDVVFSNIPKKVIFAKFGMIVSHLLAVWKSVETLTKLSLKFHRLMPLFNNYALLLGKQPFSIFHKWKDKGINTLAEVC